MCRTNKTIFCISIPIRIKNILESLHTLDLKKTYNSLFEKTAQKAILLNKYVKIAPKKLNILPESL